MTLNLTKYSHLIQAVINVNVDLITFNLFARDLARRLPGSRLQKIFQPQKEQFVFKFRLPGENFFLFLSLEQGSQKVHPIPEKMSPSIPPTSFCMMLRKHLEGGILDEVEVIDDDRILPLVFEVKRGGELFKKTLHLEFAGTNCNAIITDPAGRYVGAFSRRDPDREILTGQPYSRPPTPPGPGPILMTRKYWDELLEEYRGKKDAVHGLFPGVNRLYVAEVFHRAGLSAKQAEKGLKPQQVDALWKSWNEFVVRLKECDNLKPVLYYDDKDPATEGSPIGWAPWPLESIEGKPRRSFKTISEMLGEYFLPRVSQGQYQEVSTRLLSGLRKKLKKVLRRIEKQERDLEGAMRAKTMKRNGELLLANLYRIEGKACDITVDNYYQDPPELVTIKLNPSLTPSENAQNYFRRYKKALRGQQKIQERLKISRQEVFEIEGRIADVEGASNLEELQGLLDSYAVDSFYPSGKLPRRADGQPVSRPRAFELDKGYVALVGRNSKQNDEITLKVGKKEDLWFHARQIPGSHVVLKVQKPSHTIPSQVLYRAAQLAAYYSRASSATTVPVDYTKIKNVRKAKGAKPGEVLYSDEKTIMAQPKVDPEHQKPKEGA